MDDVSLHSATSVPLIQETILKMFLGMPHNLYVYRSLDLKLELLDEAVGTQDGNVILSVRCLKKKTVIFHLILCMLVNYLGFTAFRKDSQVYDFISSPCKEENCITALQ